MTSICPSVAGEQLPARTAPRPADRRQWIDLTAIRDQAGAAKIPGQADGGTRTTGDQRQIVAGLAQSKKVVVGHAVDDGVCRALPPEIVKASPYPRRPPATHSQPHAVEGSHT